MSQQVVLFVNKNSLKLLILVLGVGTDGLEFLQFYSILILKDLKIFFESLFNDFALFFYNLSQGDFFVPGHVSLDVC